MNWCAGLFERGEHEGEPNISEQAYLKLPLLVLNFLAPSSSLLTDPVVMAGNLLVTWVQHGPAIRRCDPTHPTVSLVIATMDVKRGKVTGGEDTVNRGAGWAGKDLTAHLKE